MQPRLFAGLLVLAALAAAGCRPVEAKPLPPFSESQWRDLAAGRLPPGVRPMKLTVIDVDGDKIGRQSIAFDLDVGAGAAIPLAWERETRITDVGGSETDREARRGCLQAEVLCAASAEGGTDRVRRWWSKIVAAWPPAPDWPGKLGEFRDVKLADGALRGELSLDKAAVLADINKSLADEEKKAPGLKWRAEAVLVIKLDNTGLRNVLPRNDRYCLLRAWGLVREWMAWTYPE